MSHPDDQYVEAQCGCSLDICGECSRCRSCCTCHICSECDEGNNAYAEDSNQWCNDCERCKDHCECSDDAEEDDDKHIKCEKCGEAKSLCGDPKHPNICIDCAGCASIPCSKCPLDRVRAQEQATGAETGLRVYFKRDNDEPPNEKGGGG